MSKGEQPQALGQSLQKSFATRWAPVGGTFVLGIWLADRRGDTGDRRIARMGPRSLATESLITTQTFAVCPSTTPWPPAIPFANGTNDKGQIVGYYSGSGGFHGFLYNNGIYTAPSQIAT